MREVVTKRQITKSGITPESSISLQSSPAPPPPPPPAPPQYDGELISLGSPEDKMAALTLDDKNDDEDNEKPFAINDNETGSSINEVVTESDLPPLIVESTPVEEEAVEFVDHVESELQLMPKCLEALAEMQKLFAFLGNSSRLYGSVSHYVRALNTKLTSNGWEFSDQTYESKAIL